MRKAVVLDRNLVVSAFLNPEGVASLALQVATEHFDVAASRATLAELADVLKRDKFDRYASKAERISRLEAYAQTVLVMHPYQGTAVLGLRAFVDGSSGYL